jgi:hypothetical protein
MVAVTKGQLAQQKPSVNTPATSQKRKQISDEITNTISVVLTLIVHPTLKGLCTTSSTPLSKFVATC